MTKIVVLSDSHDHPGLIKEIIKTELPFDELVYCGDGINDLAAAHLPKGFIINAVTGNVDRAQGHGGPEQLFIEIGGKKFFITHGDFYGVKFTLDKIRHQGAFRMADIILFGHTHEQLCDTSRTPILINPGACGRGEYCTIEIDGDRIRPILKIIA